MLVTKVNILVCKIKSIETLRFLFYRKDKNDKFLIRLIIKKLSIILSKTIITKKKMYCRSILYINYQTELIISRSIFS